MAAWFIGCALGYYIFKMRGKRVQLTRLIVLLGWLICFGLIYAVIFASHGIETPEGALRETKWHGAFFQAFSRPTWAIAVCWVIFACHFGYGGPINTFLSLGIWQPFSRISYSIYILHIIVQVMNFARMRLPINFEFFGNVSEPRILFQLNHVKCKYFFFADTLVLG